MWDGEWEVTTYQAEKMAFDMTLFPTVFGSAATWSDSHSFVVPHQHSMSADRLAAILTFISFLLEGQPHLGEGRPYPGLSSDRQSAAYKNLVPNSHYAAEAKYVTYEPTAWWSGAASPLETDAGAYFGAVLQGQCHAGHGGRPTCRGSAKTDHHTTTRRITSGRSGGGVTASAPCRPG